MRTLILVSFVLMATMLSYCRKDETTPYRYPEIKFDGKFEQSSDDPVSPDDLTVISVTDESGISTDGTFEMESVENTKYQFFFVNSKVSGEVIYYGISDPGSQKVLINDSTTALGILMLNPYLLGSEQEQRKEFLDQACKDSKFKDLLAAIKLARKSEPHDPFNFDKQSGIYQLANEIMMSVVEKLGADEGLPKYGEKLIEIEDGPGNKVIFKNYRHIFYAAEINSNNSTETLVLSRKEKALRWQWWPLSKLGFHVTEPAKTEHEIKDGVVFLNFYGFKLDQFGNGFNAIDRAAIYNLIYGIYYAIDMVAGLAGLDDDFHGDDLPYVLKTNKEFMNITVALIEGETDELLKSIFLFLATDIGGEMVKSFIKVDLKDVFGKTLVKSFLTVMVAYDIGNENIPFFWDLIRGPHHKEFVYVSSNGVLESIKNNLPPDLEISVSPSVGYKETTVTFSAKYTDDYTSRDVALYQWKWVEDGGSDDVPWSEPTANPDTILALSGPGKMYLKVDDRMRGEDICSKYLPFYEEVKRNRIIVLGGFLLRDYPDFLENELNYKPDDSELRYVLTHSSEWIDGTGIIFNPAILNPQTDLLVVEAYPESFGEIECFQANKLAIMKFVRNGGGLLLITADMSGSESNPGTLPLAKIEVVSNKVIRNSDSKWSFMEGNELDFYSSSAFSDANISDGAIIHLVNEFGNPQLVEMYNGNGNILNSIFGVNSDSVVLNTFWYMTGAELNNSK